MLKLSQSSILLTAKFWTRRFFSWCHCSLGPLTFSQSSLWNKRQQQSKSCRSHDWAKSEWRVPQTSQWEKNQTTPQDQQVNNIDVIDLDLWSRLKPSELQSRRSISRLGKQLFRLPSCAMVQRMTPAYPPSTHTTNSAVGNTAYSWIPNI